MNKLLRIAFEKRRNLKRELKNKNSQWWLDEMNSQLKDIDNGIIILLKTLRPTLFRKHKQLKRSDINMSKLERLVSEHYAIDIKALKRKNRLTEIVHARQILMVIMQTSYSLAKTGSRYNRTHATVIHAKKCVYNSYFVTDKTSAFMWECIDELGLTELIKKTLYIKE